MSEEDDADKQHEPSQKKLDDARKKGEVPRSTDLITAGSYAGLLLACLGAGATSLPRIGDILTGFLARPDALALVIGKSGGTAVMGAILPGLGLALAPFLLAPMALALVSILGQQAFTVTGSKLAPKLNRISVLSNAKNKFGRNGLFEFAKSFVKLLIYSIVLGLFLNSRLPEIIGAMRMAPGPITLLFMELSLSFLLLVLVIALALGAVDFLWQRAEHVRKNRMSRKEMTDEHKESEGDPHLKQTRRQKGVEIAMNQMLADIPKANVVIVNPTHYAVALKWDRAAGGAPLCVAKGVDEIAARIREAAAEAGIPLHSDPPTARALHAMVEIGQEIRPEHYAAVAVAIRFAETMRKKAGAR